LSAIKAKLALKEFEKRGRWDELRRTTFFEEPLWVTEYVFSSTVEYDRTLRRHVPSFLDLQTQ